MSELRQCRAWSRTKPHLRCQGEVTELTTHTGFHWAADRDGLRFNWDEEGAMYPLDAEEIRQGQVGGDHYKKFKIQPWDVWDEYDLDRYVANCVKYLLRAGYKGPKIEDLKKARHYLDKAIEREQADGGT